MTTQITLPSGPRAVLPKRPLHLRSLCHPVSRRKAEQIFARQQVAEALQRLGG